MKPLDTINIHVPHLFLVSEPPTQPPAIAAIIDDMKRDILDNHHVPTDAMERIVPAAAENITYFSFQDPDKLILKWHGGKQFSTYV